MGLVPIDEIADQMRLESFDGEGIAVVMQKSGNITTSQQYSTPDNNFLTPLERAQFKNGGSLAACRRAVERGESLFVEYSLDGGSYYALFQSLDHHAGNEWYLVVRVSTQVTADQVRTLIFRSSHFCCTGNSYPDHCLFRLPHHERGKGRPGLRAGEICLPGQHEPRGSAHPSTVL